MGLRPVIAASGILVSLALAGCNPGEDETAAQAPPPPPVTVSPPLQQSIVEWDEYVGRFQAVDHVEVRARVSGYLQSIEFEDGDLVEVGEVLFVIDPRPFHIAVEQARATLEQAETRLTLAEQELERAQPLLSRGNISQSAFDERVQEQQEGQASVRLAEANLNAALLDLEFTNVRAPISGRVSRNLVSVGNLVTGSSVNATPLTTIVSIDPIHFYFDVSEADHLKYIRLARSGDRPSSRENPNPVELALMDEDEFMHEGRMDFVDNVIDFDSGTVTGRAILPNPDQVFVPGMFARVRLIGSGRYDALLVPETAIGTDQSRRFVYVVDADNIAHLRAVELGPLLDELRVIREGLAPEDLVIINGVQRARPGAPVTPEQGQIATLQ